MNGHGQCMICGADTHSQYEDECDKCLQRPFVEQLDGLNDDPEISHLEADRILVAALRRFGFAEVAEAFERAKETRGFWYS